MKFVSYRHTDKTSWGALTAEQEIIDLGHIATTLKLAIAQNRLSRLVLNSQYGKRLPLASVTLAAADHNAGENHLYRRKLRQP